MLDRDGSAAPTGTRGRSRTEREQSTSPQMTAYAMPEATSTRSLPKARPSGPQASCPIGIAMKEPSMS